MKIETTRNFQHGEKNVLDLYMEEKNLLSSDQH